jgi:hypothetical protein
MKVNEKVTLGSWDGITTASSGWQTPRSSRLRRGDSPWGKQGGEVRRGRVGAGGEWGRRRQQHRSGGGVRQGDDGHGGFGQGLARTAWWHCDGDGEGAAASDQTGALRRCLDKADLGSGPWRSERGFRPARATTGGHCPAWPIRVQRVAD